MVHGDDAVAARAMTDSGPAAGRPDPDDLARTGADPDTLAALGGFAYFDDDLAGARRALEAAFRGYRDQGRSRQAALVAAELADLHASGFGNRAAGMGWVGRARRLLEPLGRCVEAGYVELALVACEAGDVARLEEAAAFALGLAGEFRDAELEVRALADSGYALVARGRSAQGFARLDEAMAALSAGEVTSPSVAGKSYCALLSACDRAGDARRAEEWTRLIEASLLAPMSGRPKVMHTHCRLAYGSVLCTTGRWGEGEAAILDVLGPTGSVYQAHRSEAAIRLASLRLLQGRLDEAAELLRPYTDRAASCEPLAQLHLALGDLDVAEAVARRGLAGMGSDRLGEAPLRSVLVDIALARGGPDEARRHADALEAVAAATDSVAIAALSRLARGRVAAASLDRDGAIAAFEQARGMLEGADRPLLLGHATLGLGEVLAPAGDRGTALDHARVALELFDRCGASVLADRADALARSLGARARAVARRPAAATASLTAREREVLGLVRAGLTNPEIAQRLYISTKTAEHHVSRVLAKLGVRSRAEAAAMAAAAGVEAPPHG